MIKLFQNANKFNLNKISGLRYFSSQTLEKNGDVKTAILMLNLGGPSNKEEVEPFLNRLFSDRDIIKLPFQSIAGPLIAKRRAPAVEKLYEAIGGGSPIRQWTEKQGLLLEKLMDDISPETAPHKHYIGFRYSHPLIDETIHKMKEDNVKRVIAFSQYPQYSCSTTGSSLNNLWKTLEELKMEDTFKWSIIDRWFSHVGFIKALNKKITEGIDTFKEKLAKIDNSSETFLQNKPVLVFSAHSLPMKNVERGDPYPHEVNATVNKVMESLGICKEDGKPYQYMVAWQSKVGPLPWLVPKTVDVIEQLAKQNQSAIVIPVAFTSDHIETLSEIDIELQHLAKEKGMKLLVRSPSLNDDPLIIEAMADIVSQHLTSNKIFDNSQYELKCPGCIDNKYCRTIKNPIH
ncbi:ferrochelatase [Tieghemostelium lacteum]|uniref:Ferrochelatase n=1 Tax=Tieghemostelium lacteum TaxID=361077 RepID=A0A151Z3G8_TIELA|nr:ferrochelatase [Tieghemostelium lacteum]|eukprot:KYQ88485.1 ferrochelatase [Tieghemostelium lacteum]